MFIGDYIDRGPDSSGVVESIIAFARDHHCVFLRGNHEKMLMDAIQSGERTFWLMNGGMETLGSYQIHDPAEIPARHLEFFQQTRLWHDTPDYLFIHAGLDPDQSIEQQLTSPDIENTALWERRHIHEPVSWEKPVVFGHTPVREPLIDDRKMGIDTGCCFPNRGYGHLTALLLPERTVISQECLDFIT